MNEQDRVNRTTWSTRPALDGFGAAEGFTDDGERAAFWRIADESRNQPVLDIGVGGGRTTSVLRSLSSDYVAIDYMPEMVARCRRRFPFVDVQVGDARDLSRFADDTFHLVVFSYCGIDAVNHEDRPRILSEARRVLRPNGVFWFSTLNKEGEGPRHRPWMPILRRGNRSALRYAFETLVQTMRMPRNVFNYFRSRGLWREGDGWSVSPMSAHDYGLVVHYTSLAHQLTELERAGFKRDPEVFDDFEGKRVSAGKDRQEAFSFNILARR